MDNRIQYNGFRYNEIRYIEFETITLYNGLNDVMNYKRSGKYNEEN